MSWAPPYMLIILYLYFLSARSTCSRHPDTEVRRISAPDGDGFVGYNSVEGKVVSTGKIFKV